MSPKFSTITALVGAALVLSAPAWGKGQLALTSTSPDAFERAVAASVATESTAIVSPDAVDRVRALGVGNPSRPTTSPDAFGRAVAATADYGNNRSYDDRFATPAPSSDPVSVRPISGREIEWPQIGAGFGIGILLVLGLMLTLRLTRGRSLAHG